MASKASSDPTIALLFGLGIGLVLLAFGFKRLGLKQRIENTPTSKVRSIAMGPVEVSGRVVPSEDGLLEAPFTGSPCVYYHYKVEEYRGGKNESWQTVASGVQSKRFFLRDETGDVLVDCQGAEVDLPHDFLQVGRQDPPERIQTFMASKKLSHEGWFGLNKEMRYTEWHLAPDDGVFVTGTAGDNPFVAEGTAVEGVKDVLISKGGGSNPFYVSDKSEKQVLGNLVWQAWGGILVGLLLTVGSLAWLFMHWKIF
ncbi:hypothetical protein HYV43_05960 [Candidatus Micrarchaeota archaeon]|nr:hypothetical protein [Candidatus Micrarchaeota archaeon]